jgi:hypothetical protein
MKNFNFEKIKSKVTTPAVEIILACRNIVACPYKTDLAQKTRIS